MAKECLTERKKLMYRDGNPAEEKNLDEILGGDRSNYSAGRARTHNGGRARPEAARLLKRSRLGCPYRRLLGWGQAKRRDLARSLGSSAAIGCMRNIGGTLHHATAGPSPAPHPVGAGLWRQE